MRRSTLILAATSFCLAACNSETTTTSGTETADKMDTMEGGGVYPSPSPTLAVEPLASDPAATATQNAARNLAPSSGSAKP